MKVLLETDIAAAVNAILSGLATDAYSLGDGYTLDLVAAVKNHKAAKEALATPGASLGYRKNMVRTAVMLTKPTKA